MKIEGLPENVCDAQVSLGNTAFGDHASERVAMCISLLMALKNPSIK